MAKNKIKTVVAGALGECVHVAGETNFLRLAFGLEARVPFLDVKSVALGLGLPAKWKVHQNKPAKFLLRQAFSRDLPEKIVNRPKQKFSKGAGSSDVVAQIADREIPNAPGFILMEIIAYRIRKRCTTIESCINSMKTSGSCLQWDAAAVYERMQLRIRSNDKR